jgi:hypothetical protein
MKEDKKEQTELEKKVIENAKPNEKELIREVQEKGMSEDLIPSRKNDKAVGNISKVSSIIKSKELEVFNSFDSMMQFASMFKDSGLVSFKNPEQVATVILQGKELGLTPLVSLFNIHYISGRPSLGVHAQNALLKSKGIASRTIEDAVYLDETGQITENKKEAKDFRTTIEFARKTELFGTTIEKGVFSFKEAKTAGLSEKENWKNYPKVMIWNRAFAIGARRIAPDVLLGCMEITEMADLSGMKYEVTPENDVIILE